MRRVGWLNLVDLSSYPRKIWWFCHLRGIPILILRPLCSQRKIGVLRGMHGPVVDELGVWVTKYVLRYTDRPVVDELGVSSSDSLTALHIIRPLTGISNPAISKISVTV